MCNCNKSRAAFNEENKHAQKGTTRVKLTQNTPLVLYGNYTGRMYKFNSINDVNLIDKRDLQILEGKPGLVVMQ